MKWNVPTKGKEKGRNFAGTFPMLAKAKAKRRERALERTPTRTKVAAKPPKKGSWSQPSSWRGAYNQKSAVPDKGKSKGARTATPTRTSERGVFTGK